MTEASLWRRAALLLLLAAIFLLLGCAETRVNSPASYDEVQALWSGQ